VATATGAVGVAAASWTVGWAAVSGVWVAAGGISSAGTAEAVGATGAQAETSITATRLRLIPSGKRNMGCWQIILSPTNLKLVHRMRFDGQSLHNQSVSICGKKIQIWNYRLEFSNSQYGLIHPQISLITHTCLICQANHGRRQGKKH
jgi:hypothetical protein